MNREYTYCPDCGTKLLDTEWPRRCAACGRLQFLNPAPVAVLLQPVGDGLLTVRREVEPHRGKLALPGGFIDLGESWQQAASRELREETSLHVAPEQVELFDVASAPDGTVLIFGLAPAKAPEALSGFERTPEVSELVTLHTPRELAFALHTAMVRLWFGDGLSAQESSAET